jgi:hypothetical protein
MTNLPKLTVLIDFFKQQTAFEVLPAAGNSELSDL